MVSIEHKTFGWPSGGRKVVHAWPVHSIRRFAKGIPLPKLTSRRKLPKLHIRGADATGSFVELHDGVVYAALESGTVSFYYYFYILLTFLPFNKPSSTHLLFLLDLPPFLYLTLHVSRCGAHTRRSEAERSGCWCGWQKTERSHDKNGF